LYRNLPDKQGILLIRTNVCGDKTADVIIAAGNN